VDRVACSSHLRAETAPGRQENATLAHRTSLLVTACLIAAVLVLSTLLLDDGVAAAPDRATPPLVAIRHSGQSQLSRVPASPPPPGRSAQAATFIVQYDGGFLSNGAAMNAFQRAIDIWSAQITSPVPIRIEASFANLDPGQLGGAGAKYTLRNFSGAPLANTWYPAALANKLAGTDLFTTDADIEAVFATGGNWYFGTDGVVPPTQTDFVSVVLHEIGHGLGFSGTATMVGTLGMYGSGTAFPGVYDRFTRGNDGTTVLSFHVGTLTTGLGTLLRGGNLYWSGSAAMLGNGGVMLRLFAPATWAQGTSYSHLDESTYGPGNINSLMTPFINDGEAIHDPGPITRGLLEDIGWAVLQLTPSPTQTRTPAPTLTPLLSPTPTTTRTATSTAVISATPTITPTPCLAGGSYPAPGQTCTTATVTPSTTATALPNPGRVLMPFSSRDPR